MKVHISNNSKDLGVSAGLIAAELIKKTIQQKGFANIILATGTSQFETIQQLISDAEISWERVQMFHLDEYIGLPITHKASFRNYLVERFIKLVPNLKIAHLINGELDPETECKRLDDLILQNPIDVALVGIGENGHLAFNDPPADFHTEKPYIVVDLDEACRAQQMGEGWFETMDDVPKQAISMSIQQILKSEYIVCSVPDERKSQAVADCLTKGVSNLFPASILQNHPQVDLYLDSSSASRLPVNFQ
ncbi:glucosamine-6-phosphate deaminase [Aquirufa sp. ROCK-SH2]